MNARRLAVWALLAIVGCRGADLAEDRVGTLADGGMLVPTRQVLHPAGRSIEFHARPVDLVLSHDGRLAYVKADTCLFVLDLSAGVVRQEVKYPGKLGGSLHGIALSPDGSRLYVTVAQSVLLEYDVAGERVKLAREIPVRVKKEGESYPNGIALSRDGNSAYVCLSVNNCLVEVDVASGHVARRVDVGLAPYDVELSPDGRRAYVSDWGGRRAKNGERTAISAGTPVVVDERGIAATGALSIIDLAAGKTLAEVPVGLHPSDLVLTRDGRRLFVANANSDTISVVDTAAARVVSEVSVRPDAGLPFGSSPDALALSADERTLFAAVGGNNAVAVVSVDATPALNGFVPAGWYPSAVARHGDELCVVNVKGLGTRDPAQKGKWSTRYGAWGSVNVITIPDAATLKAYTTRATEDSRVAQVLSGQRPPRRPGVPPMKHVVYVIKENRTYDQVFGDIGRGNSDPSLCIYGERVTPNQHALARQFVLLDNYYCNGVLSTDGHQWATEGITTDYIEKSFGAWVRSYPSTGDDPLAYSWTGFIWDDALAHKLSFRNYGEFRYDKFEPFAVGGAERTGLLRPPPTTRGAFKPHLGLPAIEPYTCPDFPGFTTQILDATRADIFIRELKGFETRADWPNLMVVYLPNNHTNGMMPGSRTPAAMVADNDLAVGKIIDAVSHSKFWKDTCVFVTEDDPQDGFDHVDGHRSPCLVVSPYTKRDRVVSDFYNQTSVLRTMELMLGLPAMNQMDGGAPVMSGCFQRSPDLTPFEVLKNRVDLDERNPEKAALSGEALRMAKASEAMELDRPDQASEDELNRVLWFAARTGRPYPAEWAGAHGRGLRKLGLRLDGARHDDD